MIDNLTEAISHARKVAENVRYNANTFTERDLLDENCRKAKAECLECAKEHEQLAAWLTELQKRRESDRWIPVTERLPDTYNLILLSVRHETPARTHKAVYGGYYDGKFLTVNSVAVEGCFVEGCNTKVIAWRSLPEPYKESEGK